MELTTICQYIYHALHIPLYIYDKYKTLLQCFPKQEPCMHPSQEHIVNLWDLNMNLTLIETSFSTYYGCVKSYDKVSWVVLGPVNPIPYSTKILEKIHEEYNIDKLNQEYFDNFYSSIPNYNVESFTSTILLLNLIINQTKLTQSDIYHMFGSTQNNSVDTILYKDADARFQEAEFINNYKIEMELYHYVETGNIKKLELFYDTMAYNKYQNSHTSSSYLRQRKNEFIIGITSLSRSAIKGGFPAFSAYRLAELYIKQAENLVDPALVDKLLISASYDFTTRTAACIVTPKADDFVYRIINYVKENIYHKLNVQIVAEDLHINRSYLSHKFKEELGLDLNKYIRNCKLDEAKNLLIYSDKSLSEISNLLGFSSQSHFQTQFNNSFHMTPQKYRNRYKYK